MRPISESALLFCAPFAVLLALWAFLVPYFDVNPRLFPHLDSVVQAGLDGIKDGTLIQHIGASLLRVTVGTVLARYGSDVAWWRVVRSGGAPAIGHEDRAREHYAREGTPLVTTPSGYRVDVRAARWTP